MLALAVRIAALVVPLATAAVAPAGAQPVVPGYDVSVYATLPGPAGLSFDAAGNLFVGSDVPESAAITEQWIRRIPAGGGSFASYGPFAIPDPLGVFVDSGGDFTAEPGSVVVSGPVDPTSGQIVAIAPGDSTPQPGATVEVLHDPAAGGVSRPSYVTRGSGGLLIVDAAAKAILQLAPMAAPVPLVSSAEAPRYVATDGVGSIFVSFDSVIRSYDPAGAVVDDPLASGLLGPIPIAVSPGGDFPAGLYAIEGGSGALLRVAPDGTVTEIGSGFPANLGEMEFDAGGALYVASFSAGQVIRIGAPLPPPPPAPLGPFLCYHAKHAAGTPKPAKVEVPVADAFETRQARVANATAVCSPAAVSADDIPVPVVNDGTASLASYESRWVPRVRVSPRTVTVSNVLGTFSLETRPAGADRVMLPSGFHVGTAPAPVSNAGDPFQCYPVRRAPGEVLARRRVTVADPLGPGGSAGRSLVLGRPSHLCLPVDYDGGSAASPGDLLVCYAAKPAKGAARTTALTGVHVANARGVDQRLDMKKGSTRTTVSTRTGHVAGDVLETFSDEGTTRPGEWDLEDDDGPRWSGGGPLGEGASLKAAFGAASGLPRGTVRRWRVFVEIDIVANDTDEGPGVVMRSSGIPGIPDGIEVRAMAHGKPAGVRASSDWFTPPGGTTLESLADAEQVFEANGDGSSDPFAFQITSFGVEYELAVTAGGAGTGAPEAELCLPSSSP